VKTLLLDADGILYNFTRHCIQKLKLLTPQLWYVHYLIPKHDQVTTWDPFGCMPDEFKPFKDDVYQHIKSPGQCLEIPTYVGAHAAMARLQNLAHVLVVTSPWHGAATWAHERETALQRDFGVPHQDVLHVRSKQHVVGDIFVDDKPEHVWHWAAAHPTRQAFLWDQPWNRHVNITRLCSWQELEDLLKRHDYMACTCSAIQRADPHRHFKGCIMRDM
jgi:5'(3')-deoxyribonucleotidase